MGTPDAPQRRRPRSEPNATGYVVAVLLLVGFGIFAIVDGCGGLEAAEREASWKRAPARIVEARWREVGRNSKRHAFVVTVRYRYAVGGKRYVGSRVSAKQDEWYRGSRAEALSRVARLPGREITIWYDPRQPSQAVVERQSASSERVSIYAGVGCIVAGFGVAGFFWWRLRRSRPGVPDDAQPS